MSKNRTSDLKEEQIQLEIQWLRSHFCSDVPNERELREVTIEIIESREEAIRRTQEADKKIMNTLIQQNEESVDTFERLREELQSKIKELEEEIRYLQIGLKSGIDDVDKLIMERNLIKSETIRKVKEMIDKLTFIYGLNKSIFISKDEFEQQLKRL